MGIMRYRRRYDVIESRESLRAQETTRKEVLFRNEESLP